MHSSGPVGRHRQLILVLEGELYLIPFALLKGSSSNEYLYERFSLISVPSLASLGATIKVSQLCALKKLYPNCCDCQAKFLQFFVNNLLFFKSSHVSCLVFLI